MGNELKRDSDFDDIVFTNRNKEYGAYLLRRKYSRNVFISILIGILIMSVSVITPYLDARALKNQQKHTERQVEIKLEAFDQPDEPVAPPPPAPPADIVRQQKYIPPQVVDSINSEETDKLMTTDQAQTEVTDPEPVDAVGQVKDPTGEMSEPEPFLAVEEMPEPPGGLPGLYKYIAENTHYPVVAEENNIQGKVYVRFCVTSKGTIDQVSILRGVNPELDAEALRVVKTFPSFKPGRQAGIPVPVWVTVFINFQL